MRSEKQKLEKVEELLRSQPASGLSPHFKQRVMAEVRNLPAPALAAPPTARRGLNYALSLLTGGEKALSAVLLLATIALLLPGTGELLGAWDWQLSGLSVDLAIGETALSLSLMTVITSAVAVVATIFVGAFSTRHRLIGV